VCSTGTAAEAASKKAAAKASETAAEKTTGTAPQKQYAALENDAWTDAAAVTKETAVLTSQPPFSL